MATRLVLALLGLSLPLAGCALREEPTGPAELRVTRDFGAEELATGRTPRVAAGQTVLGFLQDERDVEVDGGAVRSIDGLAGAWTYFVNGSAPGATARRRALAPGEVIQWDLRPDDGPARRVPAIVGAFPEPFRSGFGGRKVPVRVECDDDRSVACRRVKDRLAAVGVAASGARLNTEAGPGVLRVIVAPWRAASTVAAAGVVGRGPAESGVFARFGRRGRRLDLLDSRGRNARPAPPGTGLVAATQATGQRPVWVVTGVERAGVERAATALDPRVLRHAYAVAVTPTAVERLPLPPGG